MESSEMIYAKFSRLSLLLVAFLTAVSMFYMLHNGKPKVNYLDPDSLQAFLLVGLAVTGILLPSILVIFYKRITRWLISNLLIFFIAGTMHTITLDKLIKGPGQSTVSLVSVIICYAMVVAGVYVLFLRAEESEGRHVLSE